MIENLFNPGTQEQRQAALCELEALLFYRVSFRQGKATVRLFSKFLKKEIEKTLEKWKDNSCSQTDRINIVKTTFLPKIIYRSV